MNESKEDLDKRQKKLKKKKEKREKKEIIHIKSKMSHNENLCKKLKKKRKPKPRIPKNKKLKPSLRPVKKHNNNKYYLLKQIIIEIFSVYENLNTINIMNVIKNVYAHYYARSTISEVCNMLEREGYLIRSKEKYIGRGRPKALWVRGKKK